MFFSFFFFLSIVFIAFLLSIFQSFSISCIVYLSFFLYICTLSLLYFLLKIFFFLPLLFFDFYPGGILSERNYVRGEYFPPTVFLTVPLCRTCWILSSSLRCAASTSTKATRPSTRSSPAAQSPYPGRRRYSKPGSFRCK